MAARLEQAACRKSERLFLHCKVFNISVDKLVEIRPAPLHNFRRFNALALIAQFVCNSRGFCSVTTATSWDRQSTSVSELEFGARMGNKMFHEAFQETFRGMFHKMFHGCFTRDRQLEVSGSLTSAASRRSKKKIVRDNGVCGKRKTEGIPSTLKSASKHALSTTLEGARGES